MHSLGLLYVLTGPSSVNLKHNRNIGSMIMKRSSKLNPLSPAAKWVWFSRVLENRSDIHLAASEREFSSLDYIMKLKRCIKFHG